MYRYSGIGYLSLPLRPRGFPLLRKLRNQCPNCQRKRKVFEGGGQQMQRCDAKGRRPRYSSDLRCLYLICLPCLTNLIRDFLVEACCAAKEEPAKIGTNKSYHVASTREGYCRCNCCICSTHTGASMFP